MSSRRSASSATLPFISDESRTHQTQRTNSSSIAASKSKSSFSAFKIVAVLLLLVFPLLQNFRALLFLHHHHLQNDDRYKEELMNLPILEDESSSSPKKLGNSLEDIDTANKAADPIHHSTADKDVSLEEDDQQREDVSVKEDQQQKDVSLEDDAKKDGVDIAKNAAAHIQVSSKDNNNNIIITGKDDPQKDGLEIAKNAAALIQVSRKDNDNIIKTGKDDSSVKTEEGEKEEGIVPIGCKCVDCDEDNVCGGLWRGNRYQEMLSDEEAIQRKLHIVVSHCKASVSWLPSYIQKFTNVASIHVISKCGATVEGVPENTKTVVIQNVGRNDHTFAHYITSILPKLASPNDNSTVLFLKDTMDLIHQGAYFRRTDLKTLVRVASSKNGFACGLFSEDGGLSSYHDTSALRQFSIGAYNKGESDYKTADGVSFESSYKNAGALYKSLNVPSLPQVVQVCYGGIFAASTANVFKQDMKVWKAIEAALKRGDNIQEGHYIERLWGPLLSSPLESFQIEALRNYSTVIRSDFPFNGQLGRGKRNRRRTRGKGMRQTQWEKNKRQMGAAAQFHHNTGDENVPLSLEEDQQKYELDFANKVGLHIQASSMLQANYDECGTDDIISANTYTVCNGLSNQLLGHAAYVANLIKSGKKVAIPDAFIVNGVQSEKNDDGQTLKNVIPTKENSVPLTSIIEGNTLLSKIRRLGGEACFVPYDVVVTTNEEQKKDMKCSWLEQLRLSDDDIALSLLESMKPSNPLQDIVESVISNIEDKSPDFKASDGVCLHHRDGPDWHQHCSIWKGNNCMNAENMAIEDLVKYRLPEAYPKKWMYYVGDANPSPTLVQAVKEKTNLQLFHRDEDELAGNEEIGKLVGYKEPSVETHRDIYAAVDFFVCNSLSSFIGNSVSTFSAAQTALRRGSNSSWYNSRSIPLLADFLKVGVIPVVYTYTEQSQAMGKVLLKTSITSVRRTFGLNIDINVIYHGTEDKMFLKWLEERHVIVHIHEPKWLGMLHDMISHADQKSSHLYAHIGNYIGTWQRIDIPLFIDAEYIIFLDSDTVVRNKFDLSDFGKEITPGIAFSKEVQESVEIPVNAGVAIMNVPKLRETHTKFLEFIQEHAAKKQDFNLGPSDQGAYLDFYGSYETGSGVIRRKHGVSKYVKYLDTIFNVKPYYKQKETFDNRKIIHYHGLKPHDIIKALMGYHLDKFAPAVHFLFPIMFDGVVQPLCLTLHDFAISVVEEEDNLEQFCHLGFPSVAKEEIACKSFLEKLSQEETGFDCEGLMESYGYHRDLSLRSRSEECNKGYLKMHPDVAKAVEEGKLQSAFQHWNEHGKREGRTPYCEEWLKSSEPSTFDGHSSRRKGRGRGRTKRTSTVSLNWKQDTVTPISISTRIHHKSTDTATSKTQVGAVRANKAANGQERGKGTFLQGVGELYTSDRRSVENEA